MEAAVGSTVRVELSSTGGEEPVRIEGVVYTVDPVTSTLVLFSESVGRRADARDVRLVPAHAVADIRTVLDAPADAAHALVAPLPAVDLRACAKREVEAYEAMEQAMAQLNPTASPAGQAMFDALSKTMDCAWVDNSISVLDQVRVDEPYGADDCVSLDGNKNSLERIRKIVLGSSKKIAATAPLSENPNVKEEK